MIREINVNVCSVEHCFLLENRPIHNKGFQLLRLELFLIIKNTFWPEKHRYWLHYIPARTQTVND